MTKLRDRVMIMAKRPIAIALPGFAMVMLVTQPVMGQAVPRDLPPEPAPDLPSVSDYSLPPGEDESNQRPASAQAEGPSEDAAPPPQAADVQPTSPVTGRPGSDQPAVNPSRRPAPAIVQPRVEPRPVSPRNAIPATAERPRRPATGEPRNPPAAGQPVNPPTTADPAPRPGFSIGPPSDGGPAIDPPSTDDGPVAGEPMAAEPSGIGDNLWLWLGGFLALLITGAVAFVIGRKKGVNDEYPIIENTITESEADTAPALQAAAPVPVIEPEDQSATAETKAVEPEPEEPESAKAESDSDGFVTSSVNRTNARVRSAHRAVTSKVVPSLSLSFEPEGASSTLLNAVLNYRITLANTGTEAVRNIRLFGTMQQADNRLADSSVPEMGDALHQIGDIAAGDSVTLQGEIKLPLTAIKPISFKSQALFVPLAQFKMAYQDGQATDHEQSALFIIGQEYEPPRPKMAPFRLDLGPRSFGPVGQRQLNAF